MIATLILAASLAVPEPFQSWPDGLDPKTAGVRVVVQFQSTDPEACAPKGFSGTEIYGDGSFVGYSVARLWVNALEFTRVTGDVALEKSQVDALAPFLPGGEKLWKGHILLVMRGEYGTYNSNVLIGVIREEVIKAGYLVSTVATPFRKNGKPDIAALSAALRQSVDLAILIFDNLLIERCIASSGVRFVLVGDRPSKAKTCVCSIVYRRDAAAQEFAPLLKKQDVRTLMEVGCEDFADAKAAAESVGIGYSSWTIPVRGVGLQPEVTELAAMVAFSKRLAKGRSWLPDVLYFSDDYTASGALKSLMAAGVRIPDDVRVITWSNRGNGPVFPFPLAYARMDPRADGRLVAELCGLQKEKGRGSATIDSRYVRGCVG